MKNLNLEEDIKNCAEQVLEPGFKLYDFMLVHGKNILKIKVFLDKLNDPWGTPTVSDCSKFTRALDGQLVHLVNMGRMTEDYVLEISSPGAERELRGPDEWIRFQDKPMKVKYDMAPQKVDTQVLMFIKFDGDMTYWKKAILKKDKKSNNKNKMNENISILLKDINQVRLYLDF